MSGMKKQITLLSAIIFLALTFLTGCEQNVEPDPITEAAISISKDGEIRIYLVDDFDKSYYSVSELRSMAQEEVDGFNDSAGFGQGETLQIESVELAPDGSAKVVITYVFSGAQVYKGYSGMDFFYGTVEQALEEGYDLDVRLTDVKAGGAAIGKAEITDMKKRYILICQENARIICPGQVLYISEDARLNGDGSVTAGEDADYTYVISK